MKHNRKDYPKKCEHCGRWLTYRNAPAHSCFLGGHFGDMQRGKLEPVKRQRQYTQSKYEERYMWGE